jgi:hypothetical protein
MPDESEKDLREVVSRIEGELVHLKEALRMLGVQPCHWCRRYFRRADHGALIDCGDLVCYGCINEWWPHRCEELSVRDREVIERKLMRWLVAHHSGQVIHDLRKLPALGIRGSVPRMDRDVTAVMWTIACNPVRYQILAAEARDYPFNTGKNSTPQ